MISDSGLLFGGHPVCFVTLFGIMYYLYTSYFRMVYD